ncbi:hypothetical protein CPT_Milagro_052 [Burkholderia phage Milagro]|uniref:Uncharacterized protein n=1 Tax=Burkholderia phage Milagro TaxID=2924901 RepID=A0AAE9GC37_9CAUD|nr:hypothetical protein CPT_Milagro_052 [Burkholderia phage Milagro]
MGGAVDAEFVFHGTSLKHFRCHPIFCPPIAQSSASCHKRGLRMARVLLSH